MSVVLVLEPNAVRVGVVVSCKRMLDKEVAQKLGVIARRV